MKQTRADFLLIAAGSEQADCINWPYAVRVSSGYGAFNLPTGRRNKKINKDAHVHGCELKHGPRPTPQHHAAHSCGNRLCVNGSHLRWATPAENMADAKQHGTLRGGGRYRQRFFAEEIEMIASSDESCGALARRLGTDASYVSRLRRKAGDPMGAAHV